MKLGIFLVVVNGAILPNSNRNSWTYIMTFDFKLTNLAVDRAYEVRQHSGSFKLVISAQSRDCHCSGKRKVIGSGACTSTTTSTSDHPV